MKCGVHITLSPEHVDTSINVIEWLEKQRVTGTLRNIAKKWGYKYDTLADVSYGFSCVSRKMIQKYQEETDDKISCCGKINKRP